MIGRLLARILAPASWCAGCGRPWFTAERRACRCGATARNFNRSVRDIAGIDDRSTRSVKPGGPAA